MPTHLLNCSFSVSKDKIRDYTKKWYTNKMIDVLSIGTSGRGSNRAVSFEEGMEVRGKVLDFTFLS